MKIKALENSDYISVIPKRVEQTISRVECGLNPIHNNLYGLSDTNEKPLQYKSITDCKIHFENLIIEKCSECLFVTNSETVLLDCILKWYNPRPSYKKLILTVYKEELKKSYNECKLVSFLWFEYNQLKILFNNKI